MSDLFIGDCNELGQLGTGSLEQVNLPIEIFADKDIKCVLCGSESTMVLDAEGKLYCQNYFDKLAFKFHHLSITVSFFQTKSGDVDGMNTGILVLVT